MSKIIDIKTLTNPTDMFDEKKNPTKQLWAVNISDNGGKRTRGDILMIVKDQDGQDIMVNIPSTWLPVDLTQFAPLDTFSRSTNFRNYLRSNVIAIISHDTAQLLLKRPDAPSEKVRVEREIESMRGAPTLAEAGNSGSAKLNIGAGGLQVTRADDASIQSSSEEDLHNGNTPKMKEILQKVKDAQQSDMEAHHPDLVAFLTTATDGEIKALAAGLTTHTSPVYDYIDVALGNMVEGRPVTAEQFAELRDRAANPTEAPLQREGGSISISVPG